MVRLSHSLDKLLARRDALARRLEEAEFQMVRTGNRPRGSLKWCGKKGDLVQILEEALMDVNHNIKNERTRKEQIKLADSGFVSFMDLRTVAQAHQTTMMENQFHVRGCAVGVKRRGVGGDASLHVPGTAANQHRPRAS